MNKRFYEDNKAQFYKNVFALVLPMALQNLINVGVTSADVIMLGKVGEIALSASSLAGQIYFILSLILFGLTSGAAVITAQYWGKKDIVTIEDYQDSVKLENGVKSKLTLPKSFVLKYIFEDGGWFVLRPSGTEPKLKIYIAIKGNTQKEAEQFINQLKSEILSMIDEI